MTQLCFAELDEPRARSTDPGTSHAAASRAKELQAAHCATIRAALEKYGPMGKDGIAARTRLDGVQVCRRLVELERANLVRATGRNVKSTAGRAEREWMAW